MSTNQFSHKKKKKVIYTSKTIILRQQLQQEINKKDKKKSVQLKDQKIVSTFIHIFHTSVATVTAAHVS